MKEDIRSREDIELLLAEFYKGLLKDDLIGYIFTEVAAIDLESHLPILSDFWESVLLGNMIYKRNVMLKHIELNQKSALLPEHFERWLNLWEQTLDILFTGPKAEEAKKRAKLMAELMKHKIRASEEPGHIL